MDFTAKNMDSQFEKQRPILSFVGDLTRLAAVLINCPGGEPLIACLRQLRVLYAALDTPSLQVDDATKIFDAAVPSPLDIEI